jgi:hypothetical protein
MYMYICAYKIHPFITLPYLIPPFYNFNGFHYSFFIHAYNICGLQSPLHHTFFLPFFFLLVTPPNSFPFIFHVIFLHLDFQYERKCDICHSEFGGSLIVERNKRQPWYHGEHQPQVR